VRHFREKGWDVTFLLKNIGHLWLMGAELDWENYFDTKKHLRIPLPTYPFEHKR
jgi:acyl transferase domain-containing protein